MEEKIICSKCGEIIEDDDYSTVNGQIVCSECISRYCCTCDRCGATVWDSDSYGDEYTNLCQHCYDNYYTRCQSCESLMHIDDAYHYNDSDYCSECYHDICSENSSIKEYSYKPEPIFYGSDSRYFGVELEIDIGGRDCDYADELLEIANEDKEHIYIKSDGSLNDGMEIVTHPMTLDYHKHFCWERIMKRAILDKAKKGNYGRYAAVNLCNYSTIEFRLFRGTLKYNTLIAALQLVNEICNAAVFMSDDEIQKLSWSEFVSDINDTELIQYLKERSLYINERINTEEDI